MFSSTLFVGALATLGAVAAPEADSKYSWQVTNFSYLCHKSGCDYSFHISGKDYTHYPQFSTKCNGTIPTGSKPKAIPCQGYNPDSYMTSEITYPNPIHPVLTVSYYVDFPYPYTYKATGSEAFDDITPPKKFKIEVTDFSKSKPSE